MVNAMDTLETCPPLAENSLPRRVAKRLLRGQSPRLPAFGGARRRRNYLNKVMDNFSQQIKTDELRKCQREAYSKILEHFSKPQAERSILVQLPTGTGKSALIAIAPFGLAKKKVLVLTPNVKLAKQIESDLDIINNTSGNIYKKFSLIETNTLSTLELYVLRLEGTVSQSDIAAYLSITPNHPVTWHSIVVVFIH